MKNISYLIEAAGLWAAYFIFRALPVDKASDLGGWIGRTVGTRLAATRKARANLTLAMPEKTEHQINNYLRDMWDNLGRVIAEYPHLLKIIQTRCEIEGEEHIQTIGKDKPCIIIGAHLANWELLPFYFNHRIDWPMTGLYRAANNPYAQALLDKCRHPQEKGTYIPKSQKGVRDMMRTLQEGGRLGQLIDQKYNAGLSVPFFGKPAMTSPAFAQLAERYNCPILPLQVIRMGGCRFKIILHPPLRTNSRSEEEMLRAAHELLEGWIRQNPGQWLWLHRRWHSKALENAQQFS